MSWDKSNVTLVEPERYVNVRVQGGWHPLTAPPWFDRKLYKSDLPYIRELIEALKSAESLLEAEKV